MSAKGMTATVLATQLAESLAKDSVQLGERIGPNVQAWLKDVAEALASQPKPTPVLLTDAELDQPFIDCDALIDRKVARAIESAVLRKNGWGE